MIRDTVNQLKAFLSEYGGKHCFHAHMFQFKLGAIFKSTRHFFSSVFTYTKQRQ